MNDNLPPIEIHPDDQLAARITAYALGEASAFEAAEIEALVEKSPELKLFLNRTRALDHLLKEAETTANQPDADWKLPEAKRAKLESILGTVEPEHKRKEHRIRRASIRVAIGIAAIFLLTLFISPMFIRQRKKADRTETATIVNYMAKQESSPEFGDGTEFGDGWGESEEKIHIAGRVRSPGAVDFKDGITLREAVVGAGGATEFGSEKRVKILRDGKQLTYDITKPESAQLPLKPGDTIEMPQKNWLGCGASRDELTAAPEGATNPSSGLRSGDAAITRNNIDAILNNPGRQDSDGLDLLAGQDLPLGEAKEQLAPQEPMRRSLAPAKPAEQRMRSLSKVKAAAEVDAFAAPLPEEAAKQLSATEEESMDPFAGNSGGGGGALNARPPVGGDRGASDRDSERLTADDKSKEELGYLGDQIRSSPAKAGKKDSKVDDMRRELYEAQGKYDLGKYDEAKKNYEEALRIDPHDPAARRGMEKIAATKTDYDRSAYDHTRAELLMQVDKAWELSVPAEKPSLPLTDLSEETPATQEPFSTFSLNISDASFQVARSTVEKGERPDPATIKPEQFYNAVDYGDPAPSSLEPVSAAIDQTAHPVIPGRNLVRIAVRTASTGRSAAQPLRLTLLVDQSGSMVRADRRAAMTTALEQLATLLTENDRITVIGFSRTPHLLADSIPGTAAASLPDIINQTANEGGTNLEQAINLAAQLAQRHQLEGAQNRIVLFTDGAANLGNADPERLADKVKALRQQGLAFDIAGIGTDDVNDRLLSELARHGNGRYYLVGENTAGSLAKQLAGAFRPAAENVKVQVKLNPERVGNYKLIGFEEDRLKTEDFRNDSVDAAELAADEAGVAIYQVETLPQGGGEIGEVSVRFRNTTSGKMVERSWTIPYDSTAPAFDRADTKTQLAGLSLLAAQKLQGGPLADAINFRDLAATIAKVKQAYAKSEKAQQMIRLIEALK